MPTTLRLLGSNGCLSAPPQNACARLRNRLSIGIVTLVTEPSRMQNKMPNTTQKEAWDQFYSLHARDLRRMARICRVANRDTEDLVQEVWSQVIELLPERPLDGKREGFRAWL